MNTPVDIHKLVNASLAAAVRAKINMETFKKATEEICASGEKSRSLFDMWAAIDAQIGKAYKTRSVQHQLIELRARFIDEMIAVEVARLESVFKQSLDAGWNAWLVTLAEAITLFRFRFATRWCEHALPFQESKRQVLENMRKAVRCMSQSRWSEVHQELGYLAGQEFVPQLTRARLFAMLGQIQLFILEDLRSAKEFFDASEKLAPDDGRVLSAVGDSWVRAENIEKAKSHYERAISVARGIANGYVGMGQYFEKQDQLQEAAHWYEEAIASATGDAEGYEKLLKLYGRAELFRMHETDLEPMLKRTIAVGPDDTCRHYCNLGAIYKQNKEFDKSRKWYEKALAFEERSPSGCYDWYWELIWLYEQQKKKDTLQFDKRAEKIVKRELQDDKDNNTAKNILETVAVRYYQKHDDRSAATRIYGEVLEILGESYRGDYHNRLGNLHYYYEDNKKAAEEYGQAVAAMHGNAVFHRNLVLALQRLKNYPQAIQEIETAFGIDRDEKTYKKEMALLLNAQGNDDYEGGDYRKAAERYAKAVELDSSYDVIYSNLGRAWEQLREPGKRIEALENAIGAFQRAQSLNVTKRREKDLDRLQRKKEFTVRYGEKVLDWLHVVTPIAVEVAGNLIPYVQGNTKDGLPKEVSEHIARLRTSIDKRFGVKIPGVRIRENSTDLPDGTYIIMIMEIPLESGSIALDKRFFPGSKETLSSLGVIGEEATSPLTGFWINKDAWQRVLTAKFELWDILEYPIRHLEAVIQRNLVDFLGHQEVAAILEAQSFQTLEELRARPEKLTALTTVCRALIAEEAPIRPLDEICKVFDRHYSERAGFQGIVETLRSLPLLRSHLPGNNEQYSILRLGRRFEAEIRNAIYQTSSHSVLAMEPVKCQNALTAVRNGISNDRHVALVVDDADLRPFVRPLIELEFPHIPVLSKRELETGLQIKTAGVIELEKEEGLAKPDFKSPRRLDVSRGEFGERGIDAAPETHEVAIIAFVNEAFTAERNSADDQPIRDMFSLMQEGLFYELGIILPEVRLEIDNSLRADEFRFKLNGHEYFPSTWLERDEFLVNDTVDRLTLLNIKGTKAVNPANGSECAIVRDEENLARTCRQAGLTTWGPAGFLVLTLSAEIRKSASTFQTIDVTQYILASLWTAFPELIDAVVSRFSVQQIRLVLCDLLDEEISIRDLRSILESMLAINGTTYADFSRYIVFTPHAEHLCPVTSNRDVRNLTISDYSNFVRASLKRYISHKYTRGGNTLVVYLLDHDIEKRVGDVTLSPLTNDEKVRLKTALDAELGYLPSTARNPVVLTNVEIRKTVRKLLIQVGYTNVAVVAYQELAPDMNIQPIARISWN